MGPSGVSGGSSELALQGRKRRSKTFIRSPHKGRADGHVYKHEDDRLVPATRMRKKEIRPGKKESRPGKKEFRPGKKEKPAGLATSGLEFDGGVVGRLKKGERDRERGVTGGQWRPRSRARRVPRYASLEEALLDGESSWMMPP